LPFDLDQGHVPIIVQQSESFASRLDKTQTIWQVSRGPSRPAAIANASWQTIKVIPSNSPRSRCLPFSPRIRNAIALQLRLELRARSDKRREA
jgi:hypothetical protein